ncbi:MAG: hypothetical protein IPH88_02695 [Bacteroidales bacterium]|nr:hypothetical protein [Bacteroidales bacterium]
MSHFNTYGFVLKLNPCGEIDWSYNLMLGAGQISSGLVELADHSLLAMFTNHDWVHETAYSRFIHFDESGNVISLDSLPENGNCGQHILGQDLLITNDSNYLMPSNSNNWSEVDKQLNKKWELCGTNRIGQTILSGSGNSISVTDNSQTSNSFFILEISDSGTFIREKEIQTAALNIFPNTKAICQYNDTVMAVLFFAGNSFYYINDVLQVVDTSGNTLSEILLGNFMGPVCLQKTPDNKLLALEDTGKLKLFKFQPTEPYEPGNYFTTSPINSLPFTYDSLCGYQIVTDTSLIHIDYALGFDEEQTEKERTGNIKVWPNPGSGVVNLSFDKQVLNGDILQIVGLEGKFFWRFHCNQGQLKPS